MPRPDPQGYAFQDLTVRVIAEFDVVKNHLARRDLQRRRVRGVDNFSGLPQKPEHLTHIDQSLPDFAVNRAQKPQWQGDLHHIRIDHDEIADGKAPVLHPNRRHDHDDDQPDGNDHILPDVQHRQRLPGAHGKAFIGRHRPVIARRFARLGVEILDGFIVQQAVDGLLVGIGILIIHRPADLHPPFGDLERIRHIQANRHQHGDHILPAKVEGKDHRHHRQFKDQRDDRKQHEAQKEIDTLDPAFNDPAQPPGFARDVVAHRQLVDMGEGFKGQFAQSPLPDPHKNPIPHLAEKHRAHAGQAVSNGQPNRPHRQKCQGSDRTPGQNIDGLLVQIGRGD